MSFKPNSPVIADPEPSIRAPRKQYIARAASVKKSMLGLGWKLWCS
jgi:hypothetical protein